jgi:hypothetical protein
MDNCGMPTSIVSIPNLVAVIGPMVEPHARLFRDAKYCTETLALMHASVNGAIEVGLVAYRCPTFDLMTTP